MRCMPLGGQNWALTAAKTKSVHAPRETELKPVHLHWGRLGTLDMIFAAPLICPKADKALHIAVQSPVYLPWGGLGI